MVAAPAPRPPESGAAPAGARAGVYVLARPELWALHLWHPKDTTSQAPEPVDLAAKVEEHGMAAQVFMMVRRGEWNLDAVTS